MNNAHLASALSELAELHGIQTSYQDVEGHHRAASPEALLAVLQALGAPVPSFEHLGEALSLARLGAWRKRLPPVAVAWEGVGLRVPLRLPRAEVSRARCTLEFEDGSTRQWSVDLAHLPILEESSVDGIHHVSFSLDVSASALPIGYHRLVVEVAGIEHSTAIFAAPLHVHRPDGSENEHSWGVFAPVYALSSEKNWGAGDLSDLRRLMDLVEPLGARTFAILPMLATFLDKKSIFAPSPYMPVSRLFWNEMYIDPLEVPELARSAVARELLASAGFKERVDGLRSGKLIDYAGVMELKREVLESLAKELFVSGGARHEAYEHFLSSRPELAEYAAFRAACERHGRSWRVWPEDEQRGRLEKQDRDSEAARYHRYVQFVMHEQLAALADRSRRNGEGLYLDLAVGVHPDGYDAWKNREAFALAASAGAPPDPFFTKGQDWGFPPLDPAGSREQAHSYFIGSIRAHLRYAGILRIDHVMGLHRLFWVPRGFSALDGVYVRYPAEELYAVLCLESHRAKARIIGENLGTVPDYVNQELDKRWVQRMYVGQFSMSTNPAEGLMPAEPGSLASLNTHDMATFTAFWRGADILGRRDLGLLDEEQTKSEREMRRWQRESVRQWLSLRGELPQGLPHESDEEVFAVLSGLLRALGDSEAESVLVTLEDLWLEMEPQNVPGTYEEYPNWQRKMSRGIEDIVRMDEILALLRDIDRLRRRQER